VRRPLLAVLVAGIVLLGSIAAARSQQPAPPTALLAMGDFGVGGSRQQALGTAMRRFEARNPANVLLTLGDNDYTRSPTAFHGNWRKSFGWLEGAGVAVAGALGNHDVEVEGGRYQFDLLQMPGPTYRRKVGTVELFVLNSNSVDDAQRRWLARALKTSQARWKIAVFHHPAFTCGRYRASPGVLAHWVPLLERHRVRLVLSGHDHNYQRFAPRRGVTYVVHGGGSGYFYRFTRCPSWYPRRVRRRLEAGFLYLVAHADRLDGYAVNLAGRRTDRFSLTP
jgi:tartrate-resistant acid phosphatase type 5